MLLTFIFIKVKCELNILFSLTHFLSFFFLNNFCQMTIMQKSKKQRKSIIYNENDSITTIDTFKHA